MMKTECDKWLRHEEGVMSNGTPGKTLPPEAEFVDEQEYSEL